MTNHQRWKLYTEALESPDIFLDLAWYWAVGTALASASLAGDFTFSYVSFASLLQILHFIVPSKAYKP